MKNTLTIVGGASAYMPGLMQAIIHHAKTIDLGELRLMDIDEEHLEIVHPLCAKMAANKGAEFKVNATMDLVEAVKGTDFVLNTSRPGLLDCRQIDETLPLEFDIPGQETVGPGGFFFALRSVPEAFKLADAMEAHAPKAMLLNYTNPTNIVTQALLDRGFKNVIGLCDQFDGDLAALGMALGVENPRDFDFETSGLNHATWHSNISYSGVPIGELPKEFPASANKHGGEYMLRYNESLRLAHKYPGFYPNSYMAYYTKAPAFVDYFRKNGTRTEDILKKMPLYYDHFKEEGAKEVPELKHHRGGKDFGDFAVMTLLALLSDEPKKLVHNTRNGKATPYFDENTVAEVRTLVSKDSITTLPAGPIPEEQQGLLKFLEDYQRLAAEAAASQDIRKVLKALAANPLVHNMHTSECMLNRARDVYQCKVPMFA